MSFEVANAALHFLALVLHARPQVVPVRVLHEVPGHLSFENGQLAFVHLQGNGVVEVPETNLEILKLVLLLRNLCHHRPQLGPECLDGCSALVNQLEISESPHAEVVGFFGYKADVEAVQLA